MAGNPPRFGPGVSANAISLLRDYDLAGVRAMMSSFKHCSFEELQQIFRKNVQQFKRPNAVGMIFTDEEGKKDEDEYDNVVDEVDDDEAEDDGVVVDDDEADDEVEEEQEENSKVEERPKHQVPTEGERECKKPRLAEGCGCEGEAEASI